jgi:hypothetical protein
MAIAFGWAKPTLLFNKDYLLDIEPMAISIDGSAETKKAFKFSKGNLVVAGSAQGTTTFTCTIGIQAITWPVWQMALGQLSSKETLLTLPFPVDAVVPSTGPFEITDTGIVDTDVTAAISKKGAWGRAGAMKRVATAPAAYNEFQVVPASNKLVFHSSLAGAKILYRRYKGYSNWDAIGATATPTLLNQVAFDGEIYGDTESENMLLHIPAASRISVPSINPNDVTELQIQYELLTTGDNPLPFKLLPKSA